MESRTDKVSFFASFYDAASDLGDEDRLAFYDACFAYAFDGAEPRLSGVVNTIWKLVKPNLDNSLRGQKTGLRGGRPKSQKPPVSETENPLSEETETVMDKEMDMDKDKKMDMDKGAAGKRRPPRFSKPTRSEVASFIAENNLNVDVGAFMDHYESNGWKVGRSPMKDWKATVRNWHRRQSGKAVTRDAEFEEYASLV